jgi:hypothetical protein
MLMDAQVPAQPELRETGSMPRNATGWWTMSPRAPPETKYVRLLRFVFYSGLGRLLMRCCPCQSTIERLPDRY